MFIFYYMTVVTMPVTNAQGLNICPSGSEGTLWVKGIFPGIVIAVMFKYIYDMIELYNNELL